MQYIFMLIVALVRWGAVRTWNVLTFWRNERKKPLPDRQKVDRTKAVAGLLAIAAGLAAAAWLVFRTLVMPAIAFIDRQYALYIGAALLILGLQIVRFSPQRRKLGLALAALGALLVAYGLGYLG
ncbi:MAG TPA: hypothetical protein VL283_02815 [Candidatus Baltobacteraceae bacterium]|nr:hypothetical protein [Candidatus Baltobacteraceae bacterium]